MEAIQAFDINLLNSIKETLSCDFLDSVMVFISYLSTFAVIWIVPGVVMLFFRKTRAIGIILLASLALSSITGDLILKPLINRPRPFVLNPDVTLLVQPLESASFPSTHSALAAAATVVLLVRKRGFGFIALPLALCISFSRLYLYVHYPTDVFCGILLGILCAVTALLIAKTMKLDDRVLKPHKTD